MSTGIWPLLELGKEWATLDSKLVVLVLHDPSISIRPSSPRLSLNWKVAFAFYFFTVDVMLKKQASYGCSMNL